MDIHPFNRQDIERISSYSNDAVGQDKGMDGILTETAPIYFVCGTPSDRYGFEYKALDGRHLPRPAAKHLDVDLSNKFPQRGVSTHCFRRDRVEERDAAIYIEYRWIHPNDTDHNRGAFIAVGCWVDTSLTIVQAVEALCRIGRIHDDLAARRDPDTDAFLPEFQLSAYTAPIGREICHLQLADVFSQAASGRGVYEGKFGSIVYTSEEIREGSLKRFYTPPEGANQGPSKPIVPSNQSWRAQLQDALQEAMREAPQSKQSLRRLLRLEEERARIIKAVSRSVDDGVRHSRTNGRGTAGVRRDSPDARVPRRETADPRWRITIRDIVLWVIGILFGVTVATVASLYV